ncbi:hypothetical protein ACJIZ3_005821 [Penstemon smallii]|uniref:Uncharacterized protein n=1 Tax=Penstemon smallii TaxID=265156 RepID=A0ABD3S620_9LAMI
MPNLWKNIQIIRIHFLSRMIQEEDGLTEKLMLSSSAGGSILTQSHMDSHGPVLKSENQKKDGTPSILRCFHNHNSLSFPEQDHVSTFQESEASFSGNCLAFTCSLVEDEFKSNAWNYKNDEIDPVVLNA